MGQHQAHEFPGVGADRQVRAHVDFAELVLVDVYHDLHGGSGKAVEVVAGLKQVQPGPDAQEEVGILLHEIGVPVTQAPGPAVVQGVVLRDEVYAVPGGEHRNVQHVEQLFQFRQPVCQPDAVSDEQHRPLRGVEQVDDPQDLGFQLRVCRRRGRREARQGVLVDHRGLYVQRDVQPNRALPPMGGLVDRPLQVVADHLRVIHQGSVLGDGLHHGDDIQLLHPLLADALAVDHVRPLHLAGDHEHRRGLQIGPGDAGQGVGAPRSGGDHHQAQSVVHPGAGLRGDGAGLLMKAGNILDARALPQGIVQMHGSAPGEQKHMSCPRLLKPTDDIIREFYHFPSSSPRSK